MFREVRRSSRVFVWFCRFSFSFDIELMVKFAIVETCFFVVNPELWPLHIRDIFVQWKLTFKQNSGENCIWIFICVGLPLFLANFESVVVSDTQDHICDRSADYQTYKTVGVGKFVIAWVFFWGFIQTSQPIDIWCEFDTFCSATPAFI